MTELSEWLQIMLAEIARKQDEAQLAIEESGRRDEEQGKVPTSSSGPSPQSG